MGVGELHRVGPVCPALAVARGVLWARGYYARGLLHKSVWDAGRHDPSQPVASWREWLSAFVYWPHTGPVAPLAGAEGVKEFPENIPTGSRKASPLPMLAVPPI